MGIKTDYFMSEEEQTLFEDSIKFVRENFNAKTNQLP